MKPKHPMSAYFIFSNERRAALLAENKTVLEVYIFRANNFKILGFLNVTRAELNWNIGFILKVAKITGEEWKNMTDVQKAPYEEVSFWLCYFIWMMNVFLNCCFLRDGFSR